MRWRAAMWVVCMSTDHRWAYAGASSVSTRGYLEHCTRCGEVRTIMLPRPGERPPR